MLTEEELIQKISEMESDWIERTKSMRNADKLGMAVCAFANDVSDSGKCGYLLIGVDDDGTVAGKHFTDEELQLVGALKTDGNLLPSPSMATKCFHLPKGDVVVVEVYPSRYTPIRYRGRVWIRIGPRKALASADDIRRLEEKRLANGKSFEEMPCLSASLNDLDLSLFKNSYLPLAIDAEVIGHDERTVEEQLTALNFFDSQSGHPTNLGVLLFGRYPDRSIPCAYVQHVHFAGDDNGTDILSALAFKGPLVKTVAELDIFVKAAISKPKPIPVSGFREEEVVRFPSWATRELVLNAIIHRDYAFGNAPIKFYEYGEQRLEVVNPGGLFGRVNPTNFPHVNDYRNPLLAEAMKVLGYVNKFNRGISRVRHDLVANGNGEPIFDVNHYTEFRVTLRMSDRYPRDEVGANSTISPSEEPIRRNRGIINGTINGTLNGTLKTALCSFVARHPGCKVKAIAKEFAISYRTSLRWLSSLAENIEYRGSKKTGGWYVRT